MSQFDKLVRKLRARPPEADFDDVAKVLEHFGWELDREGGSHAIFVKTGQLPFVVPKKHGRKVKQVYVDKLCDLLGLDD